MSRPTVRPARRSPARPVDRSRRWPSRLVLSAIILICVLVVLIGLVPLVAPWRENALDSCSTEEISGPGFHGASIDFEYLPVPGYVCVLRTLDGGTRRVRVGLFP